MIGPSSLSVRILDGASGGIRLLLLAALAAVALGGCSGVPWGGTDVAVPARPAPIKALGVYFAGVEGLVVHGEPRGSAAVLGRLSLHERVHRDRIERGFAHVRAEKSGLVGWVDNAKLIWQLPSTPPPALTPSEVTAPSPPPAASPPGKRGTTPSIFDPY